ncbi:MAG: hypothetical protein A3K83_04410 [Omnitrophica WOR_2 bacterium RBG_13_44_8b]|nr:MAG: hypothetical protein A3K83_04410 [Omnitrophica WOR_2 bacterium RBG_13_44_8b]
MRLNIAPGEEIHLLLDGNKIRQSKIYQLLSNDFFSIEQTQPIIEKDYLNKILLLTYLTPKERPGRFGFEARIQAVTSDARIILHKLNDPAPCDLRTCPRISHNLLPNIRAYCQEKESQVIDISSIGVHIILYEGEEEYDIDAVIKMKFIFENGKIDIEGKILRKWKDNYQRNHLAISFSDNNNISQFIY